MGETQEEVCFFVFAIDEKRKNVLKFYFRGFLNSLTRNSGLE